MNREHTRLQALYERCRAHPEKLSGELLNAFARGLEWRAENGRLQFVGNHRAYAAFKAGRHCAPLWRVVRRADGSIERLERVGDADP